jgi:polysaccharide biosynthesis protein PslH
MNASPRPRLLYVTHRVPYPPDKGDRIRCYNIVRYLAARADLHLACLADEPLHPEARAALGPLCRALEVVPLGGLRWFRAGCSLLTGGTVSEGAFSSPELARVIRAWADEGPFDAALASASSVAPYLMQPALRDVPAVVDLMDVDSQKWHDYADSNWGPKSWLYRLEGVRLRRLEQRLAAWARALLLVAPAEAELFRRVLPACEPSVVTNGVDLEYFRPGTDRVAEEASRCVFVGALDYLPNVDGVGWFCRDVWPAVRRRRPDATLALVGRNPVPEVRALGEVPGVEVVGGVPDVRPHVARAAVTVVPLRIARGVQNKVLESLAMAKPTVVSPAPLQGLQAVPGEHLLVAENVEQWADHLASLFEDAGQRRRLGAAGRAYVEENHSWERCLAPLAGFLGLAEEAIV